MKKLIRWHYKEYLFFLVITVLAGIAIFEHGFYTFYAYESPGFYREMKKEMLNYHLSFDLDVTSYYITNDTFWGWIVGIVSGSILLQRAFFNWNLKDSFGRCYVSSLPFNKADYSKLFLVRDAITIVVMLSVMVVYVPCRISTYLKFNDIYVPWLKTAIVGVAVLTGAYLFFLLGIYVLLESLFVSGILKMVGSLGVMGIVSILFARMYEALEGNSLIYSIYHFLKMRDTAGNCVPVQAGDFGQYTIFVHPLTEVPILFQGNQMFITWDQEVEVEFSMQRSLCKLYDFTSIQTYLSESLLYLLIAMLCGMFAIWLVKRHEESKEGFYHAGTPYVLMVLAAFALFFMYYENNMTIPQVLGGCMFSALFFVLLCSLYLFQGKWTKQNYVKNESSN